MAARMEKTRHAGIYKRGSRYALFARHARPGWRQWRNELEAET